MDYISEISPELLVEIDLLVDHQEQNALKEIYSISREFSISIRAAANIWYLRNRSRWSKEKEEMLIYLDKINKTHEVDILEWNGEKL